VTAAPRLVGRWLAGSALALLLGGCTGLKSSAPVDQIYVLRPTAAAAGAVVATPVPVDASLQILRVEAHPGLESERIALLRPGRRLDFYSGGRWAAGLPTVLSALIVESFRASGVFANVSEDRNVGSDFALDISVLRFEAEYADEDSAPTAQLLFDCTLLSRRERNVLASFRIAAAVPAGENRLGSVVDALDKVANQALVELRVRTAEAIARAPPPGDEPRTPGRARRSTSP
jgi:cholesterol transport system auxiliary component